MKYRQIGNSSLSASILGLGALHFGVFFDQTKTTQIIHQALNLGINFIDTAPLYGNGLSESFVGNAIRGSRDKVILSTKVGLIPAYGSDGNFGVTVTPLTDTNIRASLNKSLSALQTDYIDLLQVHAFDKNTPVEETFQTLASLVDEGKIRYFGCSNYNPDELQYVSSNVNKKLLSSFVSCQAHYNMIERRAEDMLVPLCQERGMGIICNRALSRGILTGKYKPNQPIPADSRALNSPRIRRWLDDRMLSLIQAIANWAQQEDRTSTELALAWLLGRPKVSVALIGVRNRQQLETCIRSIDWILSPADYLSINNIINECNMNEFVEMMPETFFEK